MPIKFNRISKILLVTAFCSCVFLVFAPILSSFFDPQEFVTFLNPLSEKMSFGKYMINGWSWYNDQGGLIGFFRPLASATYLIEFPVFGINPIGYKFVSLMMHLLCAFITARFVFILSHRKLLAFFAGALLVFHPGTVVATGMISARPDVMATIFSILALTSTYCLSRAGDFTWRATIPAVLMLLALASKELGMINIITLPVMYFLWPGRCKCKKNTLVFVGTLLAVGYLYFLVRKMIFCDIGGYGEFTALGDIPSHVATVIAQGTGAFYISMTVTRVLLYLSVLFVILNYARGEFRKWQKVIVGVFVVGAYSFQSLIGFTATHYAYVSAASTVLFITFFAGSIAIPGKKGKQIQAIIAVLILIAAGTVTRRESYAFNRSYVRCEKVYTSLEHISNSLPREEGSVCLVLVSENSSVEAEMRNIFIYIKSIDAGSACEFIGVREITDEVSIPVLVWTGNEIAIRGFPASASI